MFGLFKNSLQDKTEASAKLVNNTLVMSLPDALSPIVWRMDMQKIEAASFEILEENDSYILVMKTEKGALQKIAPYSEKERALKALMAASFALENSENTVASSKSTNPQAFSEPPKSNKSNWGSVVIGLLVLIVLLIAIANMTPNKGNMPISNSNANVAQSSNNNAPAGVPVSADDFLNNR